MKKEVKKYKDMLDYYMNILNFDGKKDPEHHAPKYDGDTWSFKTINGQSILGVGNIEIKGEKGDKGDKGDVGYIVSDKAALLTAAETDNAHITLSNNITFSGSEALNIRGTHCTIDLNGKTISHGSNMPFCVQSGGTLTIEGNGTVEAQECAALIVDGGHLIVNGGTFNTTDNAVFMTNGSSGRGGNIIEINGGTFEGHITTKKYIACGIYVANNDIVRVNGGTFNITDGCGILCRAGHTTIGPDVVINATDENRQSGWVGDSKIMVPSKAVVLDLSAHYPGGNPELVNNSNYETTIIE